MCMKSFDAIMALIDLFPKHFKKSEKMLQRYQNISIQIVHLRNYTRLR